jgi:hypothetical protein
MFYFQPSFVAIDGGHPNGTAHVQASVTAEQQMRSS